MNDTTPSNAGEALHAFVEGFHGSLVDGRDVAVHHSLRDTDPAVFADLAATATDPLAGHAGNRSLTRDFGPEAAGDWYAMDVLAYSAAIHECILATDPLIDQEADVIPLLEGGARFLEEAGDPPSLASALARHRLLLRSLSLERRDVDAIGWLRRHRYHGRPMPIGFWTKPRWVRLQETRQTLNRLWEGTPVLERLLHASPITRLEGRIRDHGGPWQPSPPEIAVLSAPALRQAMARRIASTGSKPLQEICSALRQQTEPLAADVLRQLLADSFWYLQGSGSGASPRLAELPASILAVLSLAALGETTWPSGSATDRVLAAAQGTVDRLATPQLEAAKALFGALSSRQTA